MHLPEGTPALLGLDRDRAVAPPRSPPQQMWEFSYWLFPAVAAVFIAAPTMRPFLAPGLFGACVAGASNSAVVARYDSCAGHGLAAAALFLATPTDTDLASASAAAAAWLLVALAVVATMPQELWPYALRPSRMLTLFAVFLLAGSCSTLPRPSCATK